MKTRKVILFPLFILIAIFLHILALLNVFPIFLSVPILFITIVAWLLSYNHKKRFKGF